MEIYGEVSSSDSLSMLGLSPGILFDDSCIRVEKKLPKGFVPKDGKVLKNQTKLERVGYSNAHMSLCNIDLVLLIDHLDCIKVPFLPEYKKQVCHHFNEAKWSYDGFFRFLCPFRRLFVEVRIWLWWMMNRYRVIYEPKCLC
jgi:hypothetical protein